MKKDIVKFVFLLFLFSILSIFIYQIKTTYKQNTIINTDKISIHDVYRRVKTTKQDYYAYLSIPKLNINRALYSINDKRNNVEKEVMVLETSNFSTGDIVLAAHSGFGSNTYFNNLEQLDENTDIYILYNENIYTYYLTEKKEVNKTGYIDLDISAYPTIKLITCNKNNKKKQLIYTAKLSKKEKVKHLD